MAFYCADGSKSHDPSALVRITSALWRFVIFPVYFRPDNGEVTLRRLEWIRFEREINRGHPKGSFQLCIRLEAFKSELAQWIFILHWLTGRLKDQLKIHECRSCFRVHCRPARLVNDWHIGHLQRGCCSVLAELEAICWHRCNPIQPLWRNGRMKIVELVRRDRRSLENRKSGVGKYALMSLSSRPVFACHIAVIRGGISPGKAVAFIVGSHAMKAVASGQLSCEMKDVG
jgi:hypothetical protein